LSATAVAAGLISAAPALALTGPEAPTDTYKSVAKLTIGDEATSRACTGTLVDARWILTAASCFANTPGTTVPAGKPALKSLATLADGKTVEIVELAPRSDRDLVMARLATPAFAITGIKRSTTAPTTGTDLTAVGFGRTKTEWVPDKLHTGTFALNASDATALTITGKGADVLCKGDTGGPLLNAAGELVGVNSRSWQGGCLGTASTETRTGALSVRTDDLADWIGQFTSRRSAAVNEAGGSGRIRWADWDGDRKPDYISVDDNGAVSVWLNKGGDVPGGSGWQALGRVATGITTDRSRVRLADFDGDGKFDYIVINPNGSVHVWLNRGGDIGGGWQGIGEVATGVTSDAGKVRFADWDGDGRTDYLVFNDAGAFDVYLNRGGDPAGSTGWQGIGRGATGVTSDRSRIRFADNDGDGKADYHVIHADGKVDLYRNRGGDVGGGWQVAGRIASGVTTDHTKVQFVDFTGDTHADYIHMGADNSATVYAWNGGDPSGPNGWTNIGKVAYGV
ncbi:FG-GAP-like repeat-containing protein, partial [Streptomyces sp. NPDC002073]